MKSSKKSAASRVAQSSRTPIDRAIWIVLDGVGAGELPDAKKYGDVGSNSLGNLSKQRKLHLPHLEKFGLGNITKIHGVSPIRSGEGLGAFGKATELSTGKDTTTGHWEMAGLVVKKGFTTYPKGFDPKIVQQWCKENKLPGVLCNLPASGTDIIKEMGEEHIASGKPILYTSADSVWQVAAHEEHFGLKKLYQICESARKHTDKLRVSRVIARPFIGNPKEGIPFERTYNRKDFAQAPTTPTYLDLLGKSKVKTCGLGKIHSIYDGKGIAKDIHTEGNADGLKKLLEQMERTKKGLLFNNLIDTDMLYGHRRDGEGYARALEEFDSAVAEICRRLSKRDLLVIVSDHGNDPTYRGTDHTREYIPVLAYSPGQTKTGAIDLGTRTSFADVGATIFQGLTGKKPPLAGKSFLHQMGLI